MSLTTDMLLRDKQDSDSLHVEQFLKQWFPNTRAYRYNSASIRIRIIDTRFENLSRDDRLNLIEESFQKLDPKYQRDIVFLLAIAPSEIDQPPTIFRDYMRNYEFEHPSSSRL